MERALRRESKQEYHHVITSKLSVQTESTFDRTFFANTGTVSSDLGTVVSLSPTSSQDSRHHQSYRLTITVQPHFNQAVACHIVANFPSPAIPPANPMNPVLNPGNPFSSAQCSANGNQAAGTTASLHHFASAL
jgi:hypothetical protein